MNIIDKDELLSSAQKSLLEKSARAPFKFGGFASLDDILTKLKVDVHIEPGKPTRSVDDYYEKAGKYWRKVYKQIAERAREDKFLWNECQKAEIKLGRLNSERKAHSQMSLLGLYDSQKNTIKLFPEAMAAADANKMDEYLVSTLAHEVMHAYFNRSGHEKYPYAMFVEEPLAEFGMLLYLHETKSQYYDWAHDNVNGKKCCYGYGAIIMDQYLGGDKSLKTYLEEYKVPIGEYQMLDFSNGRIDIPKEGDFVDVAGQPFVAEWTPVYDIPPTYFWDDATKTLGLDGNWKVRHDFSDCIRILLRYHLSSKIEHLYIGKNYICDRSCRDFDSDIPTMVSPKHKDLTSINGILVFKKDLSPALDRCGDGYYELKRNGKWGIIDLQLNPITQFKYDCIWSFDKNSLCEVRINDCYGLVNKQGAEQIPVIYEHISRKGRLYEVKLNGEEFTIDEFGNKQV